jgi:hypothetical protein
MSDPSGLTDRSTRRTPASRRLLKERKRLAAGRARYAVRYAVTGDRRGCSA